MDGLFHGKPYEQMDDLGGKPTIFGNNPYLKNVMMYFTAMLFRFFTLYIYPTKNKQRVNSQDKYFFAWNYFWCDVCRNLWHLVGNSHGIYSFIEIFHGKPKKKHLQPIWGSFIPDLIPTTNYQSSMSSFPLKHQKKINSICWTSNSNQRIRLVRFSEEGG